MFKTKSHHLQVKLSFKLEQAQPDHEFRVFCWPAEVWCVPVLDQLTDKREIDHLINFAK
jgi:hypothetical protein